MSDRIHIKIDDITFVIAPLNYLRKQELAECTKLQDGKETFDLLKAQIYYIKYALKEVKGIKNYDGSDYELEFEGDCLTDNCVSEILNLEQREKLNIVAWQQLNGIKELEDVEGVELEVKTSGN